MLSYPTHSFSQGLSPEKGVEHLSDTVKESHCRGRAHQCLKYQIWPNVGFPADFAPLHYSTYDFPLHSSRKIY
jgi:hypothetical protein